MLSQLTEFFSAEFLSAEKEGDIYQPAHAFWFSSDRKWRSVKRGFRTSPFASVRSIIDRFPVLHIRMIWRSRSTVQNRIRSASDANVRSQRHFISIKLNWYAAGAYLVKLLAIFLSSLIQPTKCCLKSRKFKLRVFENKEIAYKMHIFLLYFSYYNKYMASRWINTYIFKKNILFQQNFT